MLVLDIVGTCDHHEGWTVRQLLSGSPYDDPLRVLVRRTISRAETTNLSLSGRNLTGHRKRARPTTGICQISQNGDQTPQPSTKSTWKCCSPMPDDAKAALLFECLDAINARLCCLLPSGLARLVPFETTRKPSILAAVHVMSQQANIWSLISHTDIVHHSIVCYRS